MVFNRSWVQHLWACPMPGNMGLGSQPEYASWFLLCLLFLRTCHPQAGGKLGQYLWLMTSWEHMGCKVPLLGSYIVGALGESNETSKSSNLRQYPSLLVGANPVYIGGKQWLAFPAQGYFCWAYSTSCRCHDELLRVPPQQSSFKLDAELQLGISCLRS